MILRDTGPLVAVCDARDALNKLSLRDLGRLAGTTLVLCLPVLAEACFLLPHAVQRQRVRRFLEEFPVVADRTDDGRAMWFEVLEWLARYAEHEPDLADAWPSVLSGKQPDDRVWMYDREVRTICRRPDGRRIPLAVG